MCCDRWSFRVAWYSHLLQSYLIFSWPDSLCVVTPQKLRTFVWIAFVPWDYPTLFLDSHIHHNDTLFPCDCELSPGVAWDYPSTHNHTEHKVTFHYWGLTADVTSDFFLCELGITSSAEIFLFQVFWLNMCVETNPSMLPDIYKPCTYMTSYHELKWYVWICAFCKYCLSNFEQCKDNWFFHVLTVYVW